MSATSTGWLCGLLLVLPLAGSLLNALLGPRLGRRFVNVVGPGVVLAAFVVACVLLGMMLTAGVDQRSVTVHLWDWISLGTGNLNAAVDLTLDQLSLVMLLVITGVGCLIHWYSVGYMEHEADIARFFCYMNFFIFSMVLLVLAADVIILIVGWALVALSSYLLIGFDYRRPSAVAAARKAFITQVVGDAGLFIAAFLIVLNVRGPGGAHLFSMSLPVIFQSAASFDHGGALITGICVLLAVGAFAKSAQFPLHTWLPDAMEGPTPVSALIHAATMVTAGVYLIARFHPLFDRSPVAQGVVAAVGMGTALMAGIIALSQVDIKRVIAYSTMSQIGLMIFAAGIGAYTAAMFHLATHAVFKALLFLAAGNVIHALRGEQDIRLMGGVGSTMRATERWFLCGSFALAGVPLFAGWFSKEGLLGLGAVNGPGGAGTLLLYGVGVGLNVLTGLYAFRLWAIVFRGTPQTARVYAAHEARPVMLVPVAILGVLSVGLGIVLQWPAAVLGLSVHVFNSFLGPVFAGASSGRIAAEPEAAVAWAAIVLGTLASLAGVGAALRLWLQRRPEPEIVAARLPRWLTSLSIRRFYIDDVYEAALVQPTQALARHLRRVTEPHLMGGWVRSTRDLFADLSITVKASETGLVRDYAAYTMAAAVVLLAAVLLVVLR